MIIISDEQFAETWLAEYYYTAFQALSFVFDVENLEVLRKDTFKGIIERKNFANISSLNSNFIHLLTRRTATLIFEAKLYMSSLILCDIIQDLQTVYDKIGHSPALVDCFTEVGIRLSSDALREICISYKSLTKRERTAPAYEKVLNGLSLQYGNEFDFNPYMEWYKRLKFQD